MAAKTKRPQNKCGKCGYTWYPRGKSVSLKCPSCGSAKVGLAGPGLLGGALFVGYLLLSGGQHPPPASAPPLQETSVVAPAAVEAVTAAPQLPPFQPEVHAAGGSRDAAEVPAPAPVSQPAAEELVSPAKIYSDEEITSMENEKQYHGDDPVVRARLGLPSRETKQLQQ